MYKAGASKSDKNRIISLAVKGLPVEHITALTLVKPAQVRAVIEQFKAGKLKAGRLEYGRGDAQDQIPALREGSGSEDVEALKEQNAVLQNQLDAIMARLDGDADDGQVPEELTAGQKAARTRAANKAAKEQEEAGEE